MMSSRSVTIPHLFAAVTGLLGLALGFAWGSARAARRRGTSEDDSGEVPRQSEPISRKESQSQETVPKGLTMSPYYVGRKQSKQLRAADRELELSRPAPPTAPPSEEEDIDGPELARIYGIGGYSRSSRILLCMVGLPARGKSYISKMLMRFLGWGGFPVKLFNAGSLRRSEGMGGASASFFSSDKEATAIREQIASQCLEQAIAWLNEQSSVSVAIFDATNTTKKRRQIIMQSCRACPGITPVFVESICDNPEVLEENYNLKLGNDDYAGQDREKARADFLERVEAYAQRYETIDDDECDGVIQYIKLFNVGEKVVMCHCYGYLISNIGFFLSNIHIKPRSIWLTRHGESEDQLRGLLGSNAREITANGRKYCRALANFLRNARREMLEKGQEEGSEMLVLMGTAPIHSATLRGMSSRENSGVALAEKLSSSQDIDRNDRNLQNEFSAMSTSLLNELDGGDCNGMSYEEIQQNFPELWEEREKDKLHFRYPGPGGESYADVIGRLKPIIIELERQRRSMLVISHLAVQRCLYAYFTGTSMEELPYIDLPMHTVVELRPGPFGCAVRSVQLTEVTGSHHVRV